MLLGNEQKRRRRGSAVHPATYVLVAVAILFAAFALITLVRGGGDDNGSPFAEGATAPVPEQVAPGVPKGSGGESTQKAFDPLAFDAANASDLERRAAAGYAHPLYTLTQGG